MNRRIYINICWIVSNIERCAGGHDLARGSEAVPADSDAARHTDKADASGKVTIPAGVQLMLPVLLLHHDV